MAAPKFWFKNKQKFEKMRLKLEKTGNFAATKNEDGTPNFGNADCALLCIRI